MSKISDLPPRVMEPLTALKRFEMRVCGIILLRRNPLLNGSQPSTLPQKVIVLSAELRYKFRRNWIFDLGADAVGATQAQASNGGADFLYRYQNDDRIRGGVSYVF